MASSFFLSHVAQRLRDSDRPDQTTPSKIPPRSRGAPGKGKKRSDPYVLFRIWPRVMVHITSTSASLLFLLSFFSYLLFFVSSFPILSARPSIAAVVPHVLLKSPSPLLLYRDISLTLLNSLCLFRIGNQAGARCGVPIYLLQPRPASVPYHYAT